MPVGRIEEVTPEARASNVRDRVRHGEGDEGDSGTWQASLGHWPDVTVAPACGRLAQRWNRPVSFVRVESDAERLDRQDQIADLADALWHLAHGAINRVHLSPVSVHVLARDLLRRRAWRVADQSQFEHLQAELARLLMQ